MDVKGGSSADEPPVQVYDCNNTAAQTWQRDGQTLKALGKCLDVRWASTTNGAQVQLYTCNNTAAQNWVQQPDGTLKNPNSNKCLDVELESGTRAQIWDPLPLPSCRWARERGNRAGRQRRSALS
ncbi:MAG TPA: RICIN domain-containing protein [Streptomyces sp.]|nr:RICIN domain-containing protein [Streptomyces sp.]HET6357116.1 RICIN domain-containing protein [Streptomyces sp.]